MNLLGRRLDDWKRESWLDRSQRPEERLIRFDRWVRKQLSERLDWAWAGDTKDRRVEQCRIYLERMVLALWRRGWFLDGEALATHIIMAISTLGAQQRADKVRDFWPYFQAVVDRYVGVNSEEIRDQALRAGSHVSQAMALIGKALGPTLPELMAQRTGEVAQAKAETLREKQARLKRLQAEKKGSADQPQLF
ncbi:MAG TPA: hypothetical protein VGG34_01300 [Opitutaceae bacterium]|jgi:nitroreductase